MSVFVRNFGCSTNLANGEAILGCLAEAGFKIAHSAASAKVIIFNTCAVKGPTENRMINAIKRTPQSKKIIITGCLPVINFERLRRETRFNAAVGPAAAQQIVGITKRVINGENFIDLGDVLTAKPPLNIPHQRANPTVSIIPVSYGCLGRCAYCCVVFARGRLRSYSVTEISERLRHDLLAGAKEFWLTSQDTGCYGKDIGTNLARLLEALTSVEGDYKVRVGMMTPNTVMPFLGKLIDAFRNEHVFKFIHLPVQSGDNTVLERMMRFYRVEDFRTIVETFRRAFPQLTLATDVICGFPGETPLNFQKTLELVKEVKPDVVNVSKFFPRPRTAAAGMSDKFVDNADVKQRSAMLSQLAKQITLERNQCWIGWTGEALVDEKGKSRNSWISRNFAYKPLVIESSANLLGKTLKMQVTKAFPTYLAAAIC